MISKNWPGGRTPLMEAAGGGYKDIVHQRMFDMIRNVLIRSHGHKSSKNQLHLQLLTRFRLCE